MLHRCFFLPRLLRPSKSKCFQYLRNAVHSPLMHMLLLRSSRLGERLDSPCLSLAGPSLLHRYWRIQLHEPSHPAMALVWLLFSTPPLAPFSVPSGIILCLCVTAMRNSVFLIMLPNGPVIPCSCFGLWCCFSVAGPLVRRLPVGLFACSLLPFLPSLPP